MNSWSYVIFCFFKIFYLSASAQSICDGPFTGNTASSQLYSVLSSVSEIKMHSLGFFSLPVELKGLKFRLHVYTDRFKKENNQLLVDFPVHKHNWKLNSFVLYGVLKNKTYQVEHATDGLFKLYETVRLEKESGAKHELVVSDDSVNLVLKKNQLIEQGQFYSMKASEYHAVEHLSDIVITIVHGPDNIIPGEEAIAVGRKNLQLPKERDPEYLATDVADIVSNISGNIWQGLNAWVAGIEEAI